MCTRPDTRHGAGQRVEVADILRTHGAAYQQTPSPLGRPTPGDAGHRRLSYRGLGGPAAQCDHCGAQVIRYHSCQNRHCPKCQTLAKVRWVEARLRELLPIPYFHCVFTLPHALNPLAQGNPRLLYGLLFQTAAATLQTFGRDPQVAWGRTRDHYGPAYLEPNPGTPYPCPLCGHRRRLSARGGPLDSDQAPRLSLSRPSALQGVSRQVSHRPPRGLCAGPPPVCGVHSTPGGRPDLPAFPHTAVAAALGRLCQAALCLGTAGHILPGALYASRGAQQ